MAMIANRTNQPHAAIEAESVGAAMLPSGAGSEELEKALGGDVHGGELDEGKLKRL